MVFGGVEQERIQVNEESVWYGGEVNRINPDARRYLGEVREAIFRQEIGRAQELLNLAFAGCPDGMHPYQTMGDIRIRQENVDQYEDYMRELDLEDAVCRVSFVSGGVAYRREYFASYPADCLIVRFTADGPGSISLRIRIERGKTIDGVGRLSDNGVFLYGNLGEGGSRYVSDVLRADGTKVSREELGFAPRCCLLCGQPAHVCSRSRAHSVAELTEEITRILEVYN